MAFFTYLLITALVYNAPLILVVRITRDRIGPRASRILIATGFAAATGYTLWRVEWYDVWRHGMPSAYYLLSVYVPFLSGYAAVGWLFGTLVAPASSRTRRSCRVS
jgi:hypothetical protein